MKNLIVKFDEIAGISEEKGLALILDRSAFFFLLMMTISAPHSIAASQASYVLGILISFVRLFVSPRRSLVRTPLNLAFAIFFLWSVVTVFSSYDPSVSAGKLRGVSLFLVFFFVINNLRRIRSVRFLGIMLIMSTMVNVLMTPIERIIGRGIEIHGITQNSPLKKALLWEGDALLRVEGNKVHNPEDLVREIEKREVSSVDFYRPDFYYTVKVNRAELLDGGAMEKLGISSWKKSRNWRSQGFFGHYVTYAEVIQLILAFVFGLFVAGLSIRRFDFSTSKFGLLRFIPFSFSPILLFCVAMMALALLLTVTRASQLAFLVAASSIVVLNGNKKLIITMVISIIPLAIVGLFFLQQSREVGFFDTSDTSVSYRQQVYKEGVDLWLDNPKHFFLGVGMDMNTKKEFVQKWGLFDDGKLPVGHFHSTPLQLVVERGLFALLIWIWIAALILWILYSGFRRIEQKPDEGAEKLQIFNLTDRNWQRGIVLGSFGSAVGFFTSSIVHYNLGDGEVALVFYMLVGFGVFAATLEKDDPEMDHAARSIP